MLGEKPVPGPLSLRQISYGQARDRTWASAVTVWQKKTVPHFCIQTRVCKGSMIYTE
jgi:hypothetical protein